jgi:hypothetical protein
MTASLPERDPAASGAPRRAPLAERVVRAELAAYVERDCDGPFRIIHEFDLCQAEARIDVAAINGRLCGWEIKTAADTLARLPRQQEVYSRVFDRVWLVADARHLDRARALIPDWWGVIRIDPVGDDGCALRLVRRSRLNREIQPESVVRLLWRPEVMAELDDLGLAGGLERAARPVLWTALAAAVPRRISRAELQRRVRRRLMAREDWRSETRRTPGDGSS